VGTQQQNPTILKELLSSCNFKRGETPMWKAPIVKEVSVGLEINCYACAEL